MQALVPSLVQRNELSTAIALDSLPMTVGRAGGPALGAFLATSLGPAPALAVAAGSQLMFAVLLATLDLEKNKPAANPDPSAHGVRAAFTYMKKDPVLILLLIGIAGISVGAEPPLTLAPALSESLGASDRLVGTLVSSFGIGALGSFAFLMRMQRRFTAGTIGNYGLRTMAAGYAVVAIAPATAVTIGGFVLAGVGLTLTMTGLTTALHKRIDDVYRGRVMAVWLIAIVGTRPLVSVVTGLIADAASARWAVTTTAILLVGFAVMVRPSKLRATHQRMTLADAPLNDVQWR